MTQQKSDDGPAAGNPAVTAAGPGVDPSAAGTENAIIKNADTAGDTAAGDPVAGDTAVTVFGGGTPVEVSGGAAATSVWSWTGRDDGAGPVHRRWHQSVQPYTPGQDPGACALVGFRSDEGVRRNKGRPGAVRAPLAIRKALASLAFHVRGAVLEAGDVEVVAGDLETGQRRLGQIVAGLLDEGHFAVVLGGGHETAFGSYLGLANSRHAQAGRLGVLNLDAHFDLRADPVPSSGTPFRQMAEREAAAGRKLNYAVVGISEAGNTASLFQAAAELDVRYLLDEQCSVLELAAVRAFVQDFLDTVDAVYLTVDLDVLPAAVAPGVSAPAALGVSLEVIASLCRLVAESGKLVLCDVAELNPVFDQDQQTARVAARLINTLVRHRPGSSLPVMAAQ